MKRPKTVKPLTEDEALVFAQKLTVSLQLITMAQMLMSTAPPMKHEWKLAFNSLWRMKDKCLSLLEGITEDEDDALHDMAAECATQCLRIMEAHSAKARGEEVPPPLFMLPLNESDRMLIWCLLYDIRKREEPTRLAQEFDERIEYLLQLVLPDEPQHSPTTNTQLS